MSSFLQGFVMKRIWIHGDHKSKNESLGKSFYSLSFNFQKVSNSLTFSQEPCTLDLPLNTGVDVKINELLIVSFSVS